VEGSHGGEVDALHAEITRLLAAALKSGTNHAAEIKHLEEVQAAEIKHLHDVQDAEVANLNLAIASRDLIGQAKGVLMAMLRCSADEAFALIVTQSQHENRKVTAIAADIVARTQRPSGDGGEDH
jgi:AmiR/NasT family two-component response regulator